VSVCERQGDLDSTLYGLLGLAACSLAVDDPASAALRLNRAEDIARHELFALVLPEIGFERGRIATARSRDEARAHWTEARANASNLGMTALVDRIDTALQSLEG
jgi:hypothetical protein